MKLESRNWKKNCSKPWQGEQDGGISRDVTGNVSTGVTGLK